MAKLSLDLSGRKGLAQYPSQSLRNAYAIPDGYIVDGVFNPLIRYGYLSPSTSSVTNVTTDNTQNTHFKASLYDAVNDDFYFFEDGALYRGDTTSDTSLTRVLVTPNSNADLARDMEIYQVNGVRKMFAVYQSNAGKAEIAISSLPYNSATDDPTWLTTTVSGAFTNDLTGDAWLHVSDNGYAYFLMENQVYKIDGTTEGGANGTISSALLFPNGFKTVDSLEFRGKMLIALHSYSTDTRSVNPGFVPGGRLDCGVYIWDRLTTLSSSSDYIPLTGFNVIHKIFISPSGKVRILATDTSGYTMLLEYNGATFQTIQRIGFNAHPLYRDAVGVFANMTTWWAKDGVLYAYGSVAPGDKEGLYRLFSTSVSSTTGGVVLTATGTASTAPAIYLTYQAGGGTLTNSRLKIFTIISQAGTDTTAANTVTFPVSILPKLSTVNFIRIFGAPSATTGSTTIGTIGIYLNQSSAVWASKTVSLDQWSRGYIDIPVNKPYVNCIQLDIAFASGLTIGSSDFAPAYAEIDYSPTETNK